MKWIMAAAAIYAITTLFCLLVDSKRRDRCQEQGFIGEKTKAVFAGLQHQGGGLDGMAYTEADGDVRIPCPICGKRLTDANGHKCDGDFSLEMKCPNTRSCGLVKIDAQYIAKFLDKRNRAL